MLVVKVDGKEIEERDRWIAVGAVGVADYHPYAFLEARLEIPDILAENALALRRLGGMLMAIADEADEKVKGPVV